MYKKKIISGIQQYAASELIFRLGKFVSIFIIAKILTENDFGKYSYLISLSVIATFGLDFGITQLLLLRCSKRNHHHVLNFFIYAKATLVCIAIPLIILLIYFFKILPDVSLITIFIFISYCVTQDLQGFICTILRAQQLNKYELIIKLVSTASFLIVLALISLNSIKINYIILLIIQSILIFLLIMSSYFYKLPNLRIKLKKRGTIVILKLIIPLAIGSFLTQSSTVIDTIMLGLAGLYDENASFYLAQRILFLFQLPVTIIFAGITPYLANIFYGKNKIIEELNISKIIIFFSSLALLFQIFYVLIITIVFNNITNKYQYLLEYGNLMSMALLPLIIYPILITILNLNKSINLTSLIVSIFSILNVFLDLIIINFFNIKNIIYVMIFINFSIMISLFYFYKNKNKNKILLINNDKLIFIIILTFILTLPYLINIINNKFLLYLLIIAIIIFCLSIIFKTTYILLNNFNIIYNKGNNNEKSI